MYSVVYRELLTTASPASCELTCGLSDVVEGMAELSPLPLPPLTPRGRVQAHVPSVLRCHRGVHVADEGFADVC